MALKKILLKTTAQDKGKRLDHFLAEKLPEVLGEPLSKAKVRKLIVAGAAYLNSRRVRIASKELLPNVRVDVFVDLAKLKSDGASQDRVFQMTPDHVLYEDEYLIVVNKPAGLPTQPTLDEARDNLFAAVKRYLSQRDKVAQPYLGLHHRLDRDTSGVVLFTKVQEANLGTAELFTKHLAQKIYNAITFPPRAGQSVPGEWVIENYLGKAPGGGKRTKFTAVRSGGDFAHTDFRLIETLPHGLWVEAKPKTGRTHQIRVHLSEYGLPIQGDPVYGSQGNAPRLMLHALSLTFPHPIHKTQVTIQSPLPEDFTRCLRKNI